MGTRVFGKLALALAAISLGNHLPASADVLYTYNYDLSQNFAGVGGTFAIGTTGFVTQTTLFPAIYHNDPVGHPFQSVEFRNPGQGVDGSTLVQNPVIDVKLKGFEIDGLAGGPLNQVSTNTAFDLGPHDRAAVTLAAVPLGVSYTYSYDLTANFPGLSGDFSFVVPSFLTSSISFGAFSHTDPLGHDLQYVEFRNPGQGLDGSALISNPVIDSFFTQFEIDGFAGGPLNQFGSYTPLDISEHDRISLTISGDVVQIPEPVALPLFAAGIALLWLVRGNGATPSWRAPARIR